MVLATPLAKLAGPFHAAPASLSACSFSMTLKPLPAVEKASLEALVYSPFWRFSTMLMPDDVALSALPATPRFLLRAAFLGSTSAPATLVALAPDFATCFAP